MEYKLVEVHPAIENLQKCLDDYSSNGWTFRGIVPNNVGQYMHVIIMFERKTN